MSDDTSFECSSSSLSSFNTISPSTPSISLIVSLLACKVISSSSDLMEVRSDNILCWT
jgi:hypothetical protein